MAITSAICTSFKVELLKGVHDFTATTGDTFKIALYEKLKKLNDNPVFGRFICTFSFKIAAQFTASGLLLVLFFLI